MTILRGHFVNNHPPLNVPLLSSSRNPWKSTFCSLVPIHAGGLFLYPPIASDSVSRRKKKWRQGNVPRSTFIHEIGHNGAADPKVVNERSTSSSRWHDGWSLRGTPLSTKVPSFFRWTSPSISRRGGIPRGQTWSKLCTAR